jgi:TPR repeat protein
VPSPNGPTIGSGLLIADDIVLTAAHVLEDEGADTGAVEVEFFSGVKSKASLLWSRGHGGVDAALIELREPPVSPGGLPLPTMRWGRLTGRRPGIKATALGFPRVLQREDGRREPDQLTGSLNPAYGHGNQYDMVLGNTGRPVDAVAPWAGLSGAALFARNLVIGVVVHDREEFDADRLSVVPAWRLLAEDGFREHLAKRGCSAEAESVELAGLLTSPQRDADVPSPARLLGADAEVVPFRGRQGVLDELTAWCASDRPFDATLLTGPGGQGKTRLALALTSRMRAARWLAGFVDPRAPRRSVEALCDTCVPVLLVVDYAETRTSQVEALIAPMSGDEPLTRVRVLLLARTGAEWWEQLKRTLRKSLEAAKTLPLPALEEAVADREEAYAQALHAFAARLPREAGVDWPKIAEHAIMPEFGDERYASVLTLHLTALGALLQAGGRPVADVDVGHPEDLVLRHEQSYWEASARSRELRPRNRTLRLAVAAAALCGAASLEEAAATLQRVPALADLDLDSRLAVATWLHDLYPVPDERFWGPLQPDRLGERLIESVSDEEPEMVENLLNGASESQLELALAVAVRLGNRLHNEKNDQAARWWWAQAARRGHNDAAFQIGLSLRDSGQTKGAVTWWRDAGARGHLHAAYLLARLLEKESEDTEAREWYEAAAAGGHLDAMCRLAEISDAESKAAIQAAKKWLELAADHGHYVAAHELGRRLMAEDQRSLAIEWWRRAARGLAHEIVQEAEQLWSDGHPDEAEPLFEAAADSGHGWAAYQLGCLTLARGERHATRNSWKIAAARGVNEATRRLAEEFGEGHDHEAPG